MSKTITEDRIASYPHDIIAFMEDQYVLPETRKTIIIEDWQRDYILRPLFYDLQDDGRRKYNIALLGMPKKNGKSALGAGIGIYIAYAGEPYGETIIAANAKDQASMIIYTKMRRSISLSPGLRVGASLLKDMIELKGTGTTIRCVAHQYETVAGLNPNCTIFDELWAFGDRRFFDELTVVPTRLDPLIVIVTYAGYEQKGLLWDLYEDGMNGEPLLDTGDPDIIVRRGKKDPRMFMFWTHKNLASWVTEDYLRGQRNRLPPDVYARLHENRWVAAGGQFITKDDIDALHSTPWFIQTRPHPERPYNYVVATDLGLSHDRTARVVGHYDPADKNVYIDNIRVWEGSVDEHVDIAEVERDLVWCADTFKARLLVIDPWQLEYVIQRLKGVYNVKAFNFSTDVAHLSQIFINLIRGHRVRTYHDPMFEEELENTIIKQTRAGWRIDHYGKKRNDIVMAAGMMMTEAIKGQYADLVMPGDKEFSMPPAGFQGIRDLDF